MPRPCCPRRIGCRLQAVFFKPAGVPLHALTCVTLRLDEVEALRLADWDGLYQEQAAKQMNISRPTFARVIERARRKVADALVHGKALHLEGGAVVMTGEGVMPAADGTGPAGAGAGRSRCGCGCAQRHGRPQNSSRPGNAQARNGCGKPAAKTHQHAREVKA